MARLVRGALVISDLHAGHVKALAAAAPAPLTSAGASTSLATTR
jgi:hypothetical protein